MKRKMLRVIHINISDSSSHRNTRKKKSTMFSLIFLIALSVVGPSLCVPSDPVFKLTDADFDHFLKDKDAMLVDFYAPW